MLLNSVKKIIKVFFFLLLSPIIHANTSDTSILVMLPFGPAINQALFAKIDAPINFLVPALRPGVLPLGNPIPINPLSSFGVYDITNTLVILDESYADIIIKKLGVEKKIVAHCSGQDLLSNDCHLYHPTHNTLIPLIPVESDFPNTLADIVKQGNFSIEKKLVIIITSFKNRDWYKKNLDSVFMQNYTNYRLIYIDDCSPDETGKLVQTYIKAKNQEFRTNLVLQQEWKSQMANHYYGVYMCDDDEIVCHLDGDDWLHDEKALNTINEIYLYQDIWITYGLPLESTGGKPPRASDEIMQKVIRRNTYRSEGCWAFSHFRTFYTWLFKSLKLQDLVYKGNFANMAPAPDVAMMYPMLEMAGFHTKLIDRDVYVVNKKNPISQCNITPSQIICELDRTIKSAWPPYEPLYRPAINRISQFENKQADLVMWTQTLSFELMDALRAIESHLSHINSTIVVYNKSGCAENEILHFKNMFPACIFLDYNPQNTHFKSILDYLLTITGDYIIFTSPNCILKQGRDISLCIKELERTFAYGFYLHLNLGDELKALHAPVSDDIIAWQPNYTKHIWPQPETLGAILYRKKDIIERLAKMSACNYVDFKDRWGQFQLPERTLCLIYRY